MADKTGVTLSFPRWCGLQTKETTLKGHAGGLLEASSLLAIFLDHIISEFKVQFNPLTSKALVWPKVLPANLQILTDSDTDTLKERYLPVLPSPATWNAEIKLWQRKSECSDGEKPVTMQATTSCMSRLMYPNICRACHLLMLICVTSAQGERGNSALKLVRTVMWRTLGQGRLKALTPLFVHKDNKLDYGTFMNSYSRKHPRRQLFTNPMSDHEPRTFHTWLNQTRCMYVYMHI